jgi:hypothetical protein
MILEKYIYFVKVVKHVIKCIICSGYIMIKDWTIL